MNKNCCIFVAFPLKRATLDKIRGWTKGGAGILEKITFFAEREKKFTCHEEKSQSLPDISKWSIPKTSHFCDFWGRRTQ